MRAIDACRVGTDPATSKERATARMDACEGEDASRAMRADARGASWSAGESFFSRVRTNSRMGLELDEAFVDEVG